MKNYIHLFQIVFMVLVVYSLYHLILFNVTQRDEISLLSDIVLLLKVGSLFIGSSGMLCFLQIIKNSSFDK